MLSYFFEKAKENVLSATMYVIDAGFWVTEERWGWHLIGDSSQKSSSNQDDRT